MIAVVPYIQPTGPSSYCMPSSLLSAFAVGMAAFVAIPTLAIPIFRGLFSRRDLS